MARRLIIPALLIATFASLPALAGTGKQWQTTHSERYKDPGTKVATVSAAGAGLPTTWCGTETTADQTVNATSNDAPKFKFIYVHAMDRPNRFSEVANTMQKSIALMHSYLLQSSGETRTISVDLGTSCGPLYADIASMTLPAGSINYFTSGGAGVDINKAIDAVSVLSGAFSGTPRHYVFILDQFEDPGYISGGGEMMLDSSGGQANANNGPGAVAYVATPDGDVTTWVKSKLPEAMLHEMTHTMGGVQGNAPNATSAGHCTDGSDVMCYDDGSPEAAYYNPSVCSDGSIPGIDAVYDCNKNDYFNPAPSPGSYLASKWNVYNSKYLVRCTSGDDYCTSIPSSDPNPSNPDARTVNNDVHLYKKNKRGKRIGTVTASGAKEPGISFVRNSVSLTKLRVPKGQWKVSLCFRESGESPVCATSKRKTSKSGYLTVPKIYVTASLGEAEAYGSVTIKPLTKSLKKKRYEVRSSKTPTKYSLAF